MIRRFLAYLAALACRPAEPIDTTPSFDCNYKSAGIRFSPVHGIA